MTIDCVRLAVTAGGTLEDGLRDVAGLAQYRRSGSRSALVPVGHGVTIELRGENLTDIRIEAGTSGSDIIERATPRTLWIGLRFVGIRS